ncbi:transcriptional regulator, TetR family [Kribbella flavida DSM 17836]|uniref:Transcriptional regulator, TetR family n=1 Tax=Kribbella flavida (strain DSM 17836 / JCM 10339 / NBRC 14399) TaxID=479435 RepID=D2Q342_KRIFD|nr:TetR/AcrR family transcriptional regulator [Kribbella flavida]ADB32167.1 transcriptional regulator, TetR family [Kribbella flavida DSM 17836]
MIRPRNAEVGSRVLAAAAAEIEARGYEGLSMDRVAEQAGVAKTTIYRRWPSKAELVVALIGHLRSDVPFEPTDDPRRDLTDLVTAIAANLTATPTSLIADLAAAAAREPRVGESVRALWADRHRAVTAVVAEAQRVGVVLHDVQPAVLVDQLVGPLYYRLLVTGEPLTPDYARSLVRSVLGPEESR